ncbi:MAG: hypothetical protein ABIO39_05960 [Caulobacteraceae bacterium]
MKTSALAMMAALAAAPALTACADDYAYGPRGAYAGVDFGGYYDDFYGPYYGGYWGPGGYFYYTDRAAGRYRRDTARHFRREASAGFHEFRGHAPAAAPRHGLFGPRR